MKKLSTYPINPNPADDDLISSTGKIGSIVRNQNIRVGALRGVPQAYVDAQLALKENSSNLAIVSRTGNYNDLLNKPTIPAVPEYIVNTVNGRNNDVILTKEDVQLGNVNNTSDANKPISAATQAALNAKQALGDYATNSALTSGLATKADTVHTHTKSQITDFAHTHPIADLTATGTKDATTYLRGDGTWGVPVGLGGTDATTTTKGVVQLTNDLGGTASAPTTPTAVHKAGAETISGIKTHTAQINVNVGAGNITGINMLGSKIVTVADAVGAQDAVNLRTAQALVAAPNQQYKTTYVVGLGKVDYVLPNTSSGNRTQIQAAIDAATATAGGGRVLINMTTVTIDAPLVLKSNLEICFASRNGTLKLADGANTGLLTTAKANLNNLYVHDMTLDGNYSNQTANTSDGQAMFRIAGTGTSVLENILIENVTMKDSWKHCFFISGDNTSQNIKVIRNCKVMRHGMGSIGFGLYADYAPGTIFYGNRVEQSGEPSGVGNFNDAIEMGHLGATALNNSLDGGQLQFPFGDNSLIANNILDSNTIQNDGNTANNVIVIGNRVKNASPIAGFGGISVTGTDAIIANNTVKSSSNHGIRSFGIGHVVTGNRVDGTNKDTGVENGIYIDRTSYGIVSGNRIKNCNKAIALVQDYNVVTGNTVENVNIGVYLSPFSSSAHTMVGNQVFGNVLDGAITRISLNNQNTALGIIQGFETLDGGTA